MKQSDWLLMRISAANLGLILVASALVTVPSPAELSKNAVPQNCCESAVGYAAENQESPKLSFGVAHSHPVAQPISEGEEQDHKTEANTEPYAVKIVSQPRDGWYVAYVLITFVGMCVGGTLCVIWRQTNALREQVRQTQRSIDLLVGSERPWIIATATETEYGDVFVFSLLNCGRTPADIAFARTYDDLVNLRTERIPIGPRDVPHTDLRDFGIIA